MKHTFVKVGLLCLLVATASFGFAQITVGNFDNGNCYPLMCNDSGTNTGTNMDYEQVYAANQFLNTVNINSITFTYASEFGGSDILLGGTYSLYWGYAAPGTVNNLSTNLASNYTSGPNLLGTFTVPSGGISFGSSYTFNFAPFTYNPADGNLLIEIVAMGQDNVPNGSGNSYMESDDTGSVTSRAYCLENVGCFADSTGLVTTFGTTTSTGTTPEPGTFLMLGSGIAALGLLRRKLNL